VGIVGIGEFIFLNTKSLQNRGIQKLYWRRNLEGYILILSI
jgi:hypothetical protein